MTRTVDEAKRERAAKRASQRPSNESGKSYNPIPPRRPRFKLVPWSEYGNTQPGPERWLVDKLLPREGLAVIFGKQKSYKSFIALDLGVALASEQQWAGRTIHANGIVVYIVCEGQSGFQFRVAAYKALRPELETLDFFLIEARPNLGTHPGDVADLIASIREALGEAAPVVVFIDTLVRTLKGRDENGEGMRNFSDNAEDLAAALGCLVVAIHHQGAGDAPRSRGSTALPAASVATWRVERISNGSGETARIEVMEAKDTVSGATFLAHLGRHEFGDEHDDERESTLIVKSIEPGDSVQHQPEQRASKSSLALDVLSTTLIDHPESSPNTTGFPVNMPMTKIDHFRQALKHAGITDEENERKQWQRIKDALMAKGALRIRGAYCWRVSKGETEHGSA